MKTYILLLVLTVSSFNFAQTDKFKIHAIGLGGGVYGSSTDFEPDYGGVSFSYELVAKNKNNLISLYYGVGQEIVGEIVIDVAETTYELNLLYGKIIPLNNWIELQWHCGLGSFKLEKYEIFKKADYERTIGIPLRLILLFNLGKHWAIGLNPNVNLNSLASTSSFNVLVHYKF